jgi:hypothetical protein
MEQKYLISRIFQGAEIYKIIPTREPKLPSNTTKYILPIRHRASYTDKKY